MSKKLYQYLGANVYRLRKQCRLTQSERLAKFNAIAIQQMRVLTEDHRILKLEKEKQKS